MVRYYQQIEFTEKNLILNQMLGGILMNAVLNLQKISAKVEEKGIIYTRKCKYEG